MSRLLDFSAQALRRAPLPSVLSHRFWRSISHWNTGKAYFFPVSWRGSVAVHGGVCGVADGGLFADLAAYEPGSVQAVERILHGVRKPVVIDVGAHSGEWLFLLKALHPDAELHAFEPFPDLADYLKELSKRNHWIDVHVEGVLLGANTGRGHVYFAPGAADCASTVPQFQSNYTQQFEAERRTLDEYVVQHAVERVTLIKIDVEGGELEVLEGAQRTLDRLRPPLLMELLFTENPEHRRRQREAVALLRGFGYSFFSVQSDGRLVYQDTPEPDKGYQALNFLVMPQQRESPINVPAHEQHPSAG